MKWDKITHSTDRLMEFVDKIESSSEFAARERQGSTKVADHIYNLFAHNKLNRLCNNMDKEIAGNFFVSPYFSP